MQTGSGERTTTKRLTPERDSAVESNVRTADMLRKDNRLDEYKSRRSSEGWHGSKYIGRDHHDGHDWDFSGRAMIDYNDDDDVYYVPRVPIVYSPPLVYTSAFVAPSPFCTGATVTRFNGFGFGYGDSHWGFNLSLGYDPVDYVVYNYPAYVWRPVWYQPVYCYPAYPAWTYYSYPVVYAPPPVVVEQEVVVEEPVVYDSDGGVSVYYSEQGGDFSQFGLSVNW